jgi:hypothetical protein
MRKRIELNVYLMDGADHGAVFSVREIPQNATEGKCRDTIETGGGFVQEQEALHEKLHSYAQTFALAAGNALPQCAADRRVLAVLETESDNDRRRHASMFIKLVCRLELAHGEEALIAQTQRERG